MAQNKKSPIALYALVSQHLITILVLTIGGYLIGRYLIVKTSMAGGVCATVGAIVGIIYFVVQLLYLGKDNETQRN